jgi:hypothetical protein
VEAVVSDYEWGYKNFGASELDAEYWRQEVECRNALDRAYPYDTSDEADLEQKRLEVLERMIHGRDEVIRTCQVVDLRVLDELPCKVKEGGGQQCENPEPHGEDGRHWWSAHTIMHERMGNGHSCLSVHYDAKFDPFKIGY